MPVVNASGGATAAGTAATATASSTKKRSKSFLAALNKMRWDSVLAVIIASDPYYHYAPPQTPTHKASSATSNTDNTTADAPPSPPKHRLRQYLLSSSKTRLLVHAGAVGYLLYVVTHPSQYVPCRVVVVVGGGGASAVSRSAPSTTTGCFLYQSAEGMQLLMRGKMPRWCVLLHAIAGSLLLPLAILQKESVWYMPFAHKAVDADADGRHPTEGTATHHAGAAQAHSEAKRAQLQDARRSRRRHGLFGFVTGACAAMMVVGGVSLRSYSVFSASAASSRAGVLNFASAILLFAVPWAVLMPATTVCGVSARAAAHAMFGGVFIKAILAVPFERMLGGLWQRLDGVSVSLPARAGVTQRADVGNGVCVEVTQQVEGALERVYYKSILATTIVFGVWGVADIVRFVRLARQCVVTGEAKSA
ncbi:hypothetical protein ABB37_09758 [Leptomonas pyrrhocoris]|uniref:Uncharacterized protein n=1 Tax=Leptomonas pyrrhocoris TaxID=157538 RepID=A0A0M9FQ62_LEPPY|nr:hypothetical protein ABB37_09758 [Leptomonas pyrrhocoris]KPA73626.1 hypothetical protein ABB37_09758 [Leptomonas pyrrhocoris]|eukprot:XP_015652065.1 hypothetical protein ABB37_09758 [Leptomonas pyrrhocoris]